MLFDDFPVFREYLLLRKLYVFSLTAYERVLLLDVDGVVTGSLRFLFESPMTCGADVAPPNARDEPCRAVDPEVCAPPGQPAEVLAQQTSGTPVLTAYMLVRPDHKLYRELALELTAHCGGKSVVCDRKRVHKVGWGRATGRAEPAPHDWSTRHRAPKPAARVGWSGMGAGFSDQGFVEYFFALKRRTALLVSKWSCAKRLHYLHFNVPPKPWQCPSEHCPTNDLRLGNRRWDSPDETRAWGGHHCARDWWWQYDLARRSLKRPANTCLAKCAAELDLAARDRRDSGYANYTPGPRCAHLWQLPPNNYRGV